MFATRFLAAVSAFRSNEERGDCLDIRMFLVGSSYNYVRSLVKKGKAITARGI